MQTHRVILLSRDGGVVDSSERGMNRAVTIAGPLCHSTDFLAKELHPFPEPEIDDYLLLLDCGGNTISTFSKHCSRLVPPVFAFRENAVTGEVVMAEIRREETELAAMDFWK